VNIQKFRMMVVIVFYAVLLLSIQGAPIRKTASVITASLALAASSGTDAFLPKYYTSSTPRASKPALEVLRMSSAPNDFDIGADKIVKGWRSVSMTMRQELGWRL
jgi:hypothetical protein